MPGTEKKTPQKLMHNNQDGGVNQKSIFDAGYNAYEQGIEVRELENQSVDAGVDEQFAALWQNGWQRAREDSALSRLGSKVD